MVRPRYLDWFCMAFQSWLSELMFVGNSSFESFLSNKSVITHLHIWQWYGRDILLDLSWPFKVNWQNLCLFGFQVLKSKAFKAECRAKLHSHIWQWYGRDILFHLSWPLNDDSPSWCVLGVQVFKAEHQAKVHPHISQWCGWDILLDLPWSFRGDCHMRWEFKSWKLNVKQKCIHTSHNGTAEISWLILHGLSKLIVICVGNSSRES